MSPSRLLICLVALLASCSSREPKRDAETKREKIEISTDCSSWNELTGKPPGAAFYRGTDGSVSYMDYPGRFFIVFADAGGQPYVFDYSEKGWIHSFSGNSFESIRADVKNGDDEIGSLMSSIVTSALAIAKSNRWVVYPEKGKYFASLLGKRCTVEPKAAGVFCNAGGDDCYLIPAKYVSKSGENAVACLREAGLLDESQKTALSKACEHFSKPETKNRIADVVAKSKSCPSYSVPEVQRVSAASCRDVSGFFSKINAR